MSTNNTKKLAGKAAVDTGGSKGIGAAIAKQLAATLLHGATLLLAASTAAGSPIEKPQACWLETSAGDMDAALGGAGLLETKVWHSTISSVLIRHPKGDALIDTGFGPDAEAQMNELPSAERAFGSQVLAGAKGRSSILDALATVNEPPFRVARILITHAHYDHLGGANELAAPIYVASSEADWMADQAAHPTITPPSLVAAVKPRLRTLSYNSGPYMGFEKSDDIYGDGSIVVVPLPGHTPGSQGIFVKLNGRSIFLIGDATDTLEAAERGLPKSPSIRSATDYEPEQADLTAKRLSDFHRAHPDVVMVPAHDRVAYAAVFGSPSAWASSFIEPTAQAKDSSPVIEVVTLKLKDGVTAAQFEPVDRQIQLDYISKRAGFLSRESATGSNHDWLVIVHRSEERRVGKECRSRWSPYH